MSARCDYSDLLVEACACPTHRPDVDVLPALGVHAAPHDETPSRVTYPVRHPDPPSRDLRGVPAELVTCAALYDDLAEFATGARGDDPERVTSTADERPAPARAVVVEHRHELLHLLRKRMQRIGCPPRGASVPSMVRVLRSRLAAVRDPQTFAGELRDWRFRAQRLVDLPQLRSRIPLGACPHAADALWSCAGVLWALIPADVGRTVRLRCDACQDGWDVVELPSVSGVVLPLGDVSALTGVPRGTLWHWIDDGALVETDAGVRLGDVLARLSHDPRQTAH